MARAVSRSWPRDLLSAKSQINPPFLNSQSQFQLILHVGSVVVVLLLNSLLHNMHVPSSWFTATFPGTYFTIAQVCAAPFATWSGHDAAHQFPPLTITASLHPTRGPFNPHTYPPIQIHPSVLNRTLSAEHPPDYAHRRHGWLAVLRRFTTNLNHRCQRQTTVKMPPIASDVWNIITRNTPSDSEIFSPETHSHSKYDKSTTKNAQQIATF